MWWTKEEERCQAGKTTRSKRTRRATKINGLSRLRVYKNQMLSQDNEYGAFIFSSLFDPDESGPGRLAGEGWLVGYIKRCVILPSWSGSSFLFDFCAILSLFLLVFQSWVHPYHITSSRCNFCFRFFFSLRSFLPPLFIITIKFFWCFFSQLYPPLPTAMGQSSSVILLQNTQIAPTASSVKRVAKRDPFIFPLDAWQRWVLMTNWKIWPIAKRRPAALRYTNISKIGSGC